MLLAAQVFCPVDRAQRSATLRRQLFYDVSPVTDNAPFFFFNLKLGQILRPGSLQQGMDWKVNLGVAVLGMVLAISLLAVLGFLIVPLAMGTRGQQLRPVRLLYFVAVGLGIHSG